jgi:D-tagatose-1,6-bisphosphate aldolase subunit GatZ/KbaZ
MREALFGLAAMEEELVAEAKRSNLTTVVEDAMLRHPKYWRTHYHGDAGEQHRLRIFSYSDRIRYY